jgi:hypothetical protein
VARCDGQNKAIYETPATEWLTGLPSSTHAGPVLQPLEAADKLKACGIAGRFVAEWAGIVQLQIWSSR